ncbi:hypothetical protein LTR66_016530, partial [Elasticomyces elasticus]
PGGQDSQPRKRGRPRKQEFQMVEDQPTPTVEHVEPFSPMDVIPISDVGPDQSFSPMDTMASETGLDAQFSPMETDSREAGLDQRNYSPMNTVTSDAVQREIFSPTDSFAGSNAHASPIDLVGGVDSEDDSLGDSEMSIADLRDPTEPITEVFEHSSRGYGRTSLETPVIRATEHHFLDENIHSTPSKMPSPTRERAIQSSRSSHHTTSPQPGTYPTPTPTSSLADEEAPAQENADDEHTGTDVQHADPDPIEDPNDDHEEYEEYDTIMESEGFTMISLDTLPSAKQHGFGSSAMTSSNPTQKEVGDRLKRKLPGTIEDLRANSRTRNSSSPVTADLVPKTNGITDTHVPNRQSAHADDEYVVNQVSNVNYPELPTVPSAVKSVVVPKKKTLTSLAKLVRVALALKGPFEPQAHEWSGHNNGRHKRQRLEDIFSTFGFKTRRELRIAMGLGQVIATRRMIADEEEAAAVAAKRTASRYEEQQQQADYDDFSEASDQISQSQSPENQVQQKSVEPAASYRQGPLYSPNFGRQSSVQQSPISHQKRQREAEWQLERDAVSQQAQMASNSKSVVYIDSDNTSPEEEEFDQPEAGLAYDEHPRSEIQEPENFEHEPEPEPEHYIDQSRDVQTEAEQDDDDGYDDIWQLEANDHSYDHHSEDDSIEDRAPEPPRPLGNMNATSTDQEQLSSSPDVPSEREYIARFGPSKVRELREQHVDLSALLAEEDTPNRARYYNGSSTPRSVLSRSSNPQHSPLPSSSTKQPVSRTPAHIRLQPISQSSPENGTPQISFHEWEKSPAIDHQSPAEEQPEDEPEEELEDYGNVRSPSG